MEHITSGSSEEREKLYKEAVRLGYGDQYGLPVRLMKFTTDRIMDVELAKKLVDVIGEYNEFHPDRVKAILNNLKDTIESIEIGREYSPVIYIYIPFYREGKPIPPQEMQKMVDKVKKAGWVADEIDEVVMGTVRIWWD